MKHLFGHGKYLADIWIKWATAIGIEKVQRHNYKISYLTEFFDYLDKSLSTFCNTPTNSVHQPFHLMYSAEVHILELFKNAFRKSYCYHKHDGLDLVCLWWLGHLWAPKSMKNDSFSSSSIGLLCMLCPFKALQVTSNYPISRETQFLVALYHRRGSFSIFRTSGLFNAMIIRWELARASVSFSWPHQILQGLFCFPSLIDFVDMSNSYKGRRPLFRLSQFRRVSTYLPVFGLGILVHFTIIMDSTWWWKLHANLNLRETINLNTLKQWFYSQVLKKVIKFARCCQMCNFRNVCSFSRRLI